MKLTIEIDMDNDAFEQAPEEEVKRIITEELFPRLSPKLGRMYLHDINGNLVGDAQIKA